MAKTYTRKVLTGIEGSSMLETDARTSGYGDSLVVEVRTTSQQVYASKLTHQNRQRQ